METRYHFNPVTQQSRQCEATIKSCPFPHGSTPEEAIKEFEKSEQGQEISTISKSSHHKKAKTPYDVIDSTPLKKLDSTQLTQLVIRHAEKNGMEVDKVRSSIELASTLHANQRRGNRGDLPKTMYIEHPLRNAARLTRMGVKQQDIIIAAVLHDVVEDGSKEFVEKYHGIRIKDELTARAVLSEHIETEYGKNTREIVENVTNDYIPREQSINLSPEEKNKIYYDHVKKSVEGNPEVLLVKISDFIDNATGLHHNDTPERKEKTIKQAKKYLPVARVFFNELNRTDFNSYVDKKSIETMKDQMSLTEQRMKSLIGKYKKS